MAVEFPGLTISESEYKTKRGNGKLAVFIYSGPSDPRQVIDYAIHQYVGSNGYHELIDANLDNPWMRVILSKINDIHQDEFDSQIHGIEKPINYV